MSGPGLPLEDSAEELYEHAPCGYVSTLPDGTIVRVNETLLRWTGMTREELIERRRFQDLLTPGGRIFHETHVAPMLRMQGSVRELALELRCPAGPLPVLLNAVVKRDADGAPLLTRITVLDATERRGYERELLAARNAERVARERTERLQRVTAALASAVDVRRVAAVVLDELVADFGADSALVAVEVDGGHDVVAARGDGLPVRSVEAPSFAEDGDAGATVALPIRAGDRALGVLELGFGAARTFTADDRAFLAAVAAQCGQALERALLHEATAEAGRRAALLARAGRELDELQTVADRAQRVVVLAVPELADASLLELEVRDGRRRRWGTGPDALLATADDEQGPLRLELPLAARGRPVGRLVLLRRDGRPFQDGDVPFLADFADRVALALENARLAEHERDVAHALQSSLLAAPPLHDSRCIVVTHYRPAEEGLEVGGDWYDAFPLAQDRIAIAVGDVVGRGVRAASAMGQLRSAIRALAMADLGPAEVLDRLDAFVEHLPPARMATVAYGELGLATGTLRLACAGHPPPLLDGPGGRRFLWGGRSAPLGAYAQPGARTEDTVRLAAGDRLLLYTDGLVERRDRALDDGLDELARQFGAAGDAPLREIVPTLAAGMLDGEGPRDDVCVLALGFGITGEFERHVAADPEALAPLRSDLRTWLTGNAVPPEDRDAVVLACGEAVANSIEHGYGGDRVGVVQVAGRLRARELELRVADEGAWRPPHEVQDRGRGLKIIGRLMDEVSVERGGGTTVRMRRALQRNGS